MRQIEMFHTDSRYPRSPGWKADGPSREAARKVEPFAKGVRGKVLAFFRDTFPEGHTVDELARRLNVSPFTARPRVSELHAAGLVEQTARRRANDSGASATVWRFREIP